VTPDEMPDPVPDGTRGQVVVDARGRRCPEPVIMLARVARTAGAGTEVTVLSTDPAAGPDIAAWCRMRGHRLVSQHRADGTPEDEASPEEVAVMTSVVRLVTLN
jgi:tRNA 2-thiouridine synthesizing protein A